MADTFKRVRVLIETAERCFRGYIYIPDKDPHYRLSDHLNGYEKEFICLSDVEIGERGQHWRVGEKQPFVAVATNSITYVAPLEDDKSAPGFPGAPPL
ncbi:MAG TPA: hypothetical protein VGK50_05955 [Coriobacteriia bacterium]